MPWHYCSRVKISVVTRLVYYVIYYVQLSAVPLVSTEVPVFGPIHVRVELDGLVMLVKLVSRVCYNTYIVRMHPCTYVLTSPKLASS